MPTTINPSDQTITQYNIQTGGASNLLNNVAPSATSGVPVISQGSSAQPIFGTATVPGGGTGAVTLTGIVLGNGTSAMTTLTYANGTWTPSLQFGGAAVGLTYTTQKGEYTQIGNIVFISADIAINAVGSSTGTVTITGLPVTSVQTTSGVCNILLSQSNIISAGTTTLCFNTGAGNTTLTGNISSTATGGNATMTTSNTTFANGSLFRMAGFYFSG